VTFRLLRLLALPLLLFAACAQALAADNVEITRAHIDLGEDGYRLQVAYSFDLNHVLEDAITQGVSLHFTTEIQLVRPRWYWRDEVAVSLKKTAKISYNPISRQYNVSYVGANLGQSFNTLDEAMFAIRRPPPWTIAPRGALGRGDTYTVTLKFGIDRDYLSKPIQVNAFNNSEWRLSSNTRKFTYKAE
jgi:hypothetical protein